MLDRLAGGSAVAGRAQTSTQRPQPVQSSVGQPARVKLCPPAQWWSRAAAWAKPAGRPARCGGLPPPWRGSTAWGQTISTHLPHCNATPRCPPDRHGFGDVALLEVRGGAGAKAAVGGRRSLGKRSPWRASVGGRSAGVSAADAPPAESVAGAWLGSAQHAALARLGRPAIGKPLQAGPLAVDAWRLVLHVRPPWRHSCGECSRTPQAPVLRQSKHRPRAKKQVCINRVGCAPASPSSRAIARGVDALQPSAGLAADRLPHRRRQPQSHTSLGERAVEHNVARRAGPLQQIEAPKKIHGGRSTRWACWHQGGVWAPPQGKKVDRGAV